MTVYQIAARRFADNRGWFTESYNEARFAAHGLDSDWCQDNHSLSRAAGTLRGLHFQREPWAQAKIVRCLVGRIFDVAVDVRPQSPTFKHWVGRELSAENGLQLLIPKGYAHGFVTLEPDSEVAYKVNAHYSPEDEGGIAWNDPEIGIAWPLPSGILAPLLSAKDAALPVLAEASVHFAFNGRPLEISEITL